VAQLQLAVDVAAVAAAVRRLCRGRGLVARLVVAPAGRGDQPQCRDGDDERSRDVLAHHPCLLGSSPRTPCPGPTTLGSREWPVTAFALRRRGNDGDGADG